MRYRWHLGYVAWLLNRISGIAITLYLVLHIWVIHNLTKGPEGFNRVMKLMSEPIFDLAEIALLGAILYHAMNGARLLCIEWGTGYRAQKKLFWWAMAVGVVLFVFGAYPMLVAALRGGGASEIGEVIR